MWPPCKHFSIATESNHLKKAETIHRVFAKRWSQQIQQEDAVERERKKERC
jgi:hypothetical protein